jgi:myogenesis-regulating glycosidase
MEIDDDWEECYGAFTFNKAKFPDIKGLTDWLHEKGFTVSLWVHPFIDKECESYYNDAKANGRLVSDKNGNSDLTWWNSLLNQGAYVDFTKPDVAKWWSDRLTNLRKSSGIDSYKFDAGETSWIPKNSVLNATSKEYPSKITVEYAKTVSRFGDLIELRTGFGTQTLPSFIRMIDKDTEWTHRNGLPTLITTLLQVEKAYM